VKRFLSLFAVVYSVAFGQVPAKERMVIMISLDGFPAFAMEDPQMPIPTLRRLMQAGVSARMTTINPTVTWPNHTTMITGVRADEHGLLVNGTLVRTGAWPPVKVDPKVDKEKMVHAPTVYDAAKKSGLTTAQVDWVAINNAPGITWPFAEWPSTDGVVEKELIQKGIVTAAEVEGFTKFNILRRDQIWTQAAVHLIREHKPNLMLVHFLSLDSVHHQYGPKSLGATAAIAFLDSCVEKIVSAVREAGMEDRTTFLVVADHGFRAYTKQIRPAVAFSGAGISQKVHVVPEGGSALVYVDPSVMPQALKALDGVEGLDQVIGSDRFAELGLPSPDKDPQMSQLFLTAKPGYAFSGATGGPVTAAVPQVGGSHGYVASDADMDALFIASGYGVRGGVTIGKIANVDVAPTIARMLAVSLPSAKGKPIEAIDPAAGSTRKSR